MCPALEVDAIPPGRRDFGAKEEWKLQPTLHRSKQLDTVSQQTDRLVGLVVKASASRAEGPGFESRLRRDFFGVESYQ